MASALPVGFAECRAEGVQWQAVAEMPGAHFAILLGHPDREGPLVMRVRLPADAQVMPHRHPDARTYTVLSGEWKLGFGERFEFEGLRSYRAGSLYRLPATVAHFQATGPSGALVQIESLGPTRDEFIELAPEATPLIHD